MRPTPPFVSLHSSASFCSFLSLPSLFGSQDTTPNREKRNEVKSSRKFNLLSTIVLLVHPFRICKHGSNRFMTRMERTSFGPLFHSFIKEDGIESSCLRSIRFKAELSFVVLTRQPQSASWSSFDRQKAHLNLNECAYPSRVVCSLSTRRRSSTGWIAATNGCDTGRGLSRNVCFLLFMKREKKRNYFSL